MKTYMVGGAVRDTLLGLEVKDRDWVVVGARPEEMLTQGFKPVGSDFPVFLHPETREEYALARTERKQGRGYKGFVFYADPDVSLEDDLKRRDLTINAMAMDKRGNLIDPHGGKQDVEAKLLRHTSPAFVEDPLRVLRAARFLARFYDHGFRLAAQTKSLLQKMTAGDELASLSAERVWVETAKALTSPMPQVFFATLHEVGGLDIWYPEIAQLFGVPQPRDWHPEIDSGVHTLMVLEQAAKLSPDLSLRFAALCHDLGKGTTPKKNLPSHHGHEERGVPLARQLCERLRVPKEASELAVLVCRYHTHCHLARTLRATTLLRLFDAFDLWRRPQRLKQLGLVAKADSLGRQGMENTHYDHDQFLLDLAEKVRALPIADVIQGVEKKEIPRKVRDARLKRIQDTLAEMKRN